MTDQPTITTILKEIADAGWNVTIYGPEPYVGGSVAIEGPGYVAYWCDIGRGTSPGPLDVETGIRQAYARWKERVE